MMQCNAGEMKVAGSSCIADRGIEIIEGESHSISEIQAPFSLTTAMATCWSQT